MTFTRLRLGLTGAAAVAAVGVAASAAMLADSETIPPGAAPCATASPYVDCVVGVSGLGGSIGAGGGTGAGAGASGAGSGLPIPGLSCLPASTGGYAPCAGGSRHRSTPLRVMRRPRMLRLMG